LVEDNTKGNSRWLDGGEVCTWLLATLATFGAVLSSSFES